MSGDKILFGITSKGKRLVIYEDYEFVRHRQYANGNVQWRCKCYQTKKCRARITTKEDEIVSKETPIHSHTGSKERVLARQAVAEMKEKMSEAPTTTTRVIDSVSTKLQSNVISALPKKASLQRTLSRKRQKLQSDLGSSSYSPPSGKVCRISDEFSDPDFDLEDFEYEEATSG